MRLAVGTLSGLPMPVLLPRGLACVPPPTLSVPLNLGTRLYVLCTIPDPLLVDTINPEPKEESRAFHFQ